jgi:predicted MFS family arabinose efflux permease
VLLTAGLMIGVYAILGIEQEGWAAPQTLGLGALSAALIVAFFLRQARIANPLVPLRLFRARGVWGANTIQALTVVGMFSMFFLGALYLQTILDYSALEVGLAFLPSTIVMGFMSLKVSGPFAQRYGLRAAIVPSLVLIAIGLLLFARTPVDGTYAIDILPSMLVFGLGAGLGFPAIVTLAMRDVEMQDTGLASGLVNTSAQVGGAIGLAVLATLAAERTDAVEATAESANAALNAGYHLAYVVGAVLIAAAVGVALYVLRDEAPAAEAAAPDEVYADAA